MIIGREGGRYDRGKSGLLMFCKRTFLVIKREEKLRCCLFG
jgi:hypothetical protein